VTGRAAVVLAWDVAPRLRAGPPDPALLRLAFCEDVYEMLAGLELLDAGVAVPAGHDRAEVESITWPGAPVIELIDGDHGPDNDVITDVRNDLVAALAGLHKLGYEQAAVVAVDAPDLPGLLLGKLFRALGRADITVCPARSGGLVAVAARLPLAGWVSEAGVDLDTPDALARLRAVAPTRASVGVGPGWHRVRTPEDLARLDPGLEGWAATRAVRSTAPAG
jgi:hypothetical protein